MGGYEHPDPQCPRREAISARSHSGDSIHELCTRFATFASHWIPAWARVQSQRFSFLTATCARCGCSSARIAPVFAPTAAVAAARATPSPRFFLRRTARVSVLKSYGDHVLSVALRSRPVGAAGPASDRRRDPWIHPDSGDVLSPWLLRVVAQLAWSCERERCAELQSHPWPRKPADKPGCAACVHCLATFDLGTGHNTHLSVGQRLFLPFSFLSR